MPNSRCNFNWLARTRGEGKISRGQEVWNSHNFFVRQCYISRHYSKPLSLLVAVTDEHDFHLLSLLGFNHSTGKDFGLTGSFSQQAVQFAQPYPLSLGAFPFCRKSSSLLKTCRIGHLRPELPEHFLLLPVSTGCTGFYFSFLYLSTVLSTFYGSTGHGSTVLPVTVLPGRTKSTSCIND